MKICIIFCVPISITNVKLSLETSNVETDCDRQEEKGTEHTKVKDQENYSVTDKDVQKSNWKDQTMYIDSLTKQAQETAEKN
jgi:hypothetical protein